MPELPDVTVYVEALKPRIVGANLTRILPLTPFIVRSVDPPLSATEGATVTNVTRLGKRVVIHLNGDLHVTIHLMIAGRFLWNDKPKPSTRPGGKIGMAVFDFSTGQLLLTEASSKKRASIHVGRGEEQLTKHDPGGLEPLECGLEDFHMALKLENRTLKRALTNPRIFSGIGNAYSDEILHAAKLSPLRLTQALTDTEVEQLWRATRDTLSMWIVRLQAEFAGRFPKTGEITAFRPDYAAHGKFGKPCPECGMPIQRIRYAENETNYCAKCQNEGRVLMDRALSRLLKSDWPKTVEEMVEGPRTPRDA